MALTICGAIASNVTVDCGQPPSGGLESRIILFNFEDVVSLSKDADDDLIVNDINLKSGAKGYEWNILGDSANIAAWEFVVKDTTRLKMVSHSVTTAVMNKTTGNKRTVNDMKDGRYIALVINRSNLNDTKYEILGANAGLEIPEGGWSSAENDGIINVVLRTQEGQEEPFIPYTFQVGTGGNYDRAATAAAVDLLLTPAT